MLYLYKNFNSINMKNLEINKENQLIMELEMNSRIYKIKSSITAEEERERVMMLGHEDIMEIFQFTRSLKALVIENPNDSELELTFAEMSDEELKRFLKYSEMTGILYEILDITEDVIFNREITEAGNNLEYIKILVFNPFLLQNLTTDFILDKINLHGIDSLTDIEKQILES